MGLQPGQVFSGGNVLDADGRVVVVLEAIVAPASQPAAGSVSDADGRLVVKVVQANS